MRSILIIVLFCVLNLGLSGQVFDVDTIVFNGPAESRINIVILGDGYQDWELSKFAEDAVKITDALFAEEPYSTYKNFFNVITIAVPSNESGAGHPGTASDVNEPAHPVQTVDNYFGSRFDAHGIHRLLVPRKSSTIFNVLANNFPQYDQVIMLVNSFYYGGSGGTFATTSIDKNATEIAIHELGHSFAGLADEYYAGDQYAREDINMTKESDPAKIRWKNWLMHEGVGAYKHCCSGASDMWFRPHEECKMRILGAPFCPVCREATIEVIHELVSVVDSYSPPASVIFDSELPIVLSATLTTPEPNTLVPRWSINSKVVGSEADTLTLVIEDLEEGFNEVLFAVEDQSEMLRIDGHQNIHTEFVLWELTTGVSGVEDINVKKDKLQVRIFPNPTQDYLYLEGYFDSYQPISVDISDLTGRIVKRVTVTAGLDEVVDISSLAMGTYIVSFRKGRTTVASSKIVKL